MGGQHSLSCYSKWGAYLRSVFFERETVIHALVTFRLDLQLPLRRAQKFLLLQRTAGNLSGPRCFDQIITALFQLCWVTNLKADLKVLQGLRLGLSTSYPTDYHFPCDVQQRLS